MRIEEVQEPKGSVEEFKKFRVEEVGVPRTRLTVKKPEVELREEVELHGWEKKWEEISAAVRRALPFLDSENPTTKAMRQAAFNVDPLGGNLTGVQKAVGAVMGRPRELVAGGFVLPFAKYALPSEREIFEQLDDQDKSRAIAWETFGAALYALGPTMRLAKGPAARVANWSRNRKLLKLEPIEDAVAAIKDQNGIWNGFDHYKGVLKAAKDDLKLTKDEAEVVAQVMTGADPVALKALEYDKKITGKALSKAWEKILELPKPGEFYGKPKLKAEVASSLSYNNLQAKHYSNLYRKNMELIGRKAHLTHAEGFMKEQVRRLYGEEFAQDLAFSSMSEREISNIISSMLSPRGKKVIGSLHKLAMGEYRLPWMHAERNVYGMGETVLSTKSKIYDKLSIAAGNSNTYKIEKIGVLSEMLTERGFGSLRAGKFGMEFVPNKELWTRENLSVAYKYMQKIDQYAEAGRKGRIMTKADSAKLIDEVLNEAKANSPIAAEIISLTKDYFDVLYKEMLQIYVPKVARQAGLSARGESMVTNLERIWGPKIEAAFKTNSGKTYAERTKLVKDMLRDYRKTLQGKGLERRKKVIGPGVEGFAERRRINQPGRLPTDRRQVLDETLFSSSGKDLDKKLEDLFGRLAYGSTKPGGIPAYLDHYMPRIGARGASFEEKWRQALTGEAAFMKGRKLASSREVVPTWQEMVEARTSSQAKQLFFFDEVSEVVDYAKTLPESWQMHTDFTISRLLGRPSSWDRHLATVLQKTPWTGNWDSYRAMRAAQKITGLQYAGLIGLRPFAVFRNLTQPIIMTPAELGGGVRDSWSMLRGLGLSATKEHRAYMRSIGAITDFVPDYYRGPLLPKTGIVAKWDSMRDAFMWLFRKSDEMNRYWSGGAAVDKWDHVSKLVRGGPENVAVFSRKLGLGSQLGWVRNEVENLLHLGRVADAKAAYVRNVVANTQYLYTILDAPAMTGSGGAQKMVTAFNSWWMNYGSALSRWASTGTGTDRVKRMGSWLVHSAVAEQLLEGWAGRATAMRSTFLGPFPLGSYGMPPSLEPANELVQGLVALVQQDLAGQSKKRDTAAKHFINSLKSAGKTYVPGGLATSQMVKGFQKDEWRGLAEGILQYERKKKQKNVFDLLE